MGEHDGAWFFTEGQRHGFKVFSAKGGQALPLYVIGKNVTTNTLVVGRGEESKVHQFVVENPHWIGELEDEVKMRVGVRIRHLGEILPAVVSSSDSKPLAVGHKLLATLAEPAFGVAPGQSAVFYQKEKVLGGAVIKNL